MCITSLSRISWNFLILCRLGYRNKLISVRPDYVNNYFSRHRTVDYCTLRMSSAASNLFQGVVDRFNGVTVDSLVENCQVEDFSVKLDDSLKAWLNEAKRGIWFKVALEQSEWIPILAKSGFNFHHAKEGFVMMYKWLPKESVNIPHYAHTMIGVGAVVVNDKGEILVVKEKYGFQQFWKMPGGYVEPGENLVDAAIREVFEETGVTTQFCSLINLRHAHNAMFNCSDIYIAINLKPLTLDITIGEREINEAKWLAIDEYLNHPNVHELNKFLVQNYLEYKKNDLQIDVKHGIHQLLKKPYTVYFINTEKS